MKTCLVLLGDCQLPALIAATVVILIVYVIGHTSAKNAARRDPSSAWILRDVKCLGWMFLIAILWSMFQYFSNLC